MEENGQVPQWLAWARKLDALAQSGLTFAQTEFDVERFRQIRHIATEILAAHTTLSGTDYLETLELQQGYATPKIDVRGAVIRDGKILLVREKADGNWCMPGGWADVGEAPSESVTREIREESGFETIVKKIIGVFDANRGGRPMELYHAFKIVFLCEITGGEARPSYETLDVNFFDFDHLPELSQNRTHPRHLKVIRQHLEHPELPTFFD